MKFYESRYVHCCKFFVVLHQKRCSFCIQSRELFIERSKFLNDFFLHLCIFSITYRQSTLNLGNTIDFFHPEVAKRGTRIKRIVLFLRLNLTDIPKISLPLQCPRLHF